MEQNPENLIVFAGGNDGAFTDEFTLGACTVGSPALGKNILTVGGTSSGPSRSPDTGADGHVIYENFGLTDYSSDGSPYLEQFPALGMPSSSTEPADIDTVAWFSPYGPTFDNRIKPEIVAPADQVWASFGLELEIPITLFVSLWLALFVVGERHWK